MSDIGEFMESSEHIESFLDCYSIEKLERMTIVETNNVFKKMRAEIKQLTTERDELAAVVDNFNGFISESDGISGWHQNGNIATWDELGLDNYLDAKILLAKRDLESEAKGAYKGIIHTLNNYCEMFKPSKFHEIATEYVSELNKQAEGE